MDSWINSGSTILDALHKTSAAANFNMALSEVIGLLPVLLPVAIGFIAVRKGLAFLFQSLRKA